MTHLPLGPLATKALALRRFRMPDESVAQTSYNTTLWPGWWRESTALGAIAHLRSAGVQDDGVEAAILLVGCADPDGTEPEEIEALGGEVALGTRVIEGLSYDTSWHYWHTLQHWAFPEHRLARTALQVALLDDGLAWKAGTQRRKKVYGDAVYRVGPMLTGMDGEAARRMLALLGLRLGALGRVARQPA